MGTAKTASKVSYIDGFVRKFPLDKRFAGMVRLRYLVV